MLAPVAYFAHTCRVSPPAESLSSARVGLASSMQTAKAVFFDFDGPLCDVFSNFPAARVAEELKSVAKRFHVDLPGRLASSSDPHGILREVRIAGLRFDGAEHARMFFAAVEERLTQLETTAASKAEPTAHAYELVSALHAQGKRLLVTSNNAEGAIRAHLRAARIDALFEDVVGRDPTDPLLMKPDPYCVKLALELVRLPGEDCLLIGDQLTDAEAARGAGVPFLGYAPDEAHAAALRAGQAGDVVVSLQVALQSLRPVA
jgi:HAD superfamily hydrolase (TIGR01549 family)